MALTSDYKERKATPIVRGCLDYFPDALAAVSRLSLVANDKHNPGEPLHWSKGKSNDHADCLVRHLVERGTPDPDMRGLSHTVQVAWRALALLQTEIEERREKGLPALEYPQTELVGPTSPANAMDELQRLTAKAAAPKMLPEQFKPGGCQPMHHNPMPFEPY